MDPVTISMLVSAGVSAVQAYNANADQKQAQRDAQRLGAQLRATQEADKVSGLQVPTLGAELARQSLGQQMAMTVNALTGAGAAGVLGGIPGASAMGANAALEIAADLQRQQAARDQFVAAAQQDIEGRRVKAEREMIGDQLAGAQLQAYTSGTEKTQAIATGVGALGKGAAAEIGDQSLFKKQKQTTLSDDTITGKQLEKQVIPGMAPEVKQITLNQAQQRPAAIVTNTDVLTDEVPLNMNNQPNNPYAAFGFGYNNVPQGVKFN
jgi:hypothetical protein